MRFNTERLLVRLYGNSDKEAVYNIYKDPEICRFLPIEPWTEDDMDEEFDKKLENHSLTKDKDLNLAIEIDDKIIGDISAWYTEMRQTVEVDYSFLNEYRGEGYAVEALRALIEELFSKYDVHRIRMSFDARCEDRQNVCERIGMRKEAHFIQDFWNKGEWTDSIVYGMLPSDL